MSGIARHAGSSMGLLAICTVVFGAVFALRVAGGNQRGPLSGQPPSADPCSHLAGRMKFRYDNTMPYREYSTADFVSDVNIVARAVITDIQAARFETVDGLPPPAVTATPVVTPDPDEDVYFYPDKVFSPVVLDAIEVYSGTTVAGYVVPRWGGTPTACPGFSFDRKHEPMVGNVGDSGVAFMIEPPAEWESDPPGWYVQLANTAQSLSSPGNEYRPMILDNWYLYDQQTGMASTALKLGTMPISQLEAELESATGGN